MLKLKKKVTEAELVPHLSKGSRGPDITVGTWRVVRAILYRLKIGCQWRELPIMGRCNKSITWESVDYHFRKWVRDGSWRRIWEVLLRLNHHILDMSCVSLDGSHTLAKLGGQAVAYQHRKKGKTTNMLFLTDNQGIPLACSDPLSGNHHDCYQIIEAMSSIEHTLRQANLSLEGLFMNADAGFDAQ